MNRKLLAFLMSICLVSSVLAGCGKGADTPQASGTAAADAGALPSGNVNLRVWGSEEDAELLERIVADFKSQYSGQASFNISVEAHSEANCKDDILGDVLNAPDVFTFADDQLMALVASGVLKEVGNASEI